MKTCASRKRALLIAAGFALCLATPDLLAAAPLLEHHANGNVSLKGTVDEEGLPHKRVQKFDPQGRLLWEKHYHHGVLHGVSRMHYPSGQLMTEWTYKNGKREGAGVGYFANGNVKDEGFYKNNKLHGRVRKYYPDGVLKTEMNFEKDRQQGETRTYTRSGSLEYVYTYRSGILQNRKRYDAQGKLILEQDFSLPPVPP